METQSGSRSIDHTLGRLLGVACCALAFVVAAASSAHAGSIVGFVHTTSADNISGSFTELDHPLLNDHPHARVLVTQAWNYVAGQGGQNDRAIGVRYDVDYLGNGRWSIFNQDLVYAMEEGLVFHVVVLGEDTASFLHLASYDSIQNIASVVHCPPDFVDVCNGLGGPILHSHTLDADGLRGARMLTPTSAFYSSPSLLVRAESTDPDNYPNMRPGSLYWLLAGGLEDDGELVFQHTATAANTSAWATTLDDPRLNGNPNAILFVSRIGAPGPTLEERIGILYANDGTNDVWSVIHETTEPIPEGASFGVFVAPLLSDGFESGDTSWWSQ